MGVVEEVVLVILVLGIEYVEIRQCFMELTLAIRRGILPLKNGLSCAKPVSFHGFWIVGQH
jgi:hypothetical protein